MDYESFKEKFVEDVKDRLYEQGAEVDLSIHTVNKLNESYEAITVTPEGSNIGVNIGIDKFYGAVEDGRPYDEVVDKAVDVINIGINKLECLLRSPRCPFVLYVGKKKLVKRKEFEKFISDNIEI